MIAGLLCGRLYSIATIAPPDTTYPLWIGLFCFPYCGLAL